MAYGLTPEVVHQGPRHLRLGKSFQGGAPANMLIANAVPPTLLLGLASLIVCIISSVPLGFTPRSSAAAGPIRRSGCCRSQGFHSRIQKPA
jgi:hypothetical protein